MSSKRVVNSKVVKQTHAATVKHPAVRKEDERCGAEFNKKVIQRRATAVGLG